jgi:hypothetical protein
MFELVPEKVHTKNVQSCYCMMAFALFLSELATGSSRTHPSEQIFPCSRTEQVFASLCLSLGWFLTLLTAQLLDTFCFGQSDSQILI